MAKAAPTIATVYLPRPAILTGVKDEAVLLLGNFGLSDEALFDVIEGKVKPEGNLAFELPSSMDDVVKHASGLPHDSKHPLFPIHYGLKLAD